MQFSHIFIAASALVSSALSAPAANSDALQVRDTVKLNQYSSVDDCHNDNNILYHAAPVSSRCYTLDAATNSFFLNTGGYWFCYAFAGENCDGQSYQFGRESGACYDKGTVLMSPNGTAANSVICK